MKLKTFVDDLAKQGIALWPDGDELNCEGPEDRLTPGLLQELRAHKAELLAFLRHDAQIEPLSHSQRALWIEEQMAPQNRAYHISIAVRIHSPVDIDALHQAFQRLVNRHAMLRTTFLVQDEQPVQKIHRYRPAAWTLIDAHDWPQPTIRQAVMAAHEAPFDFENGPLFRIKLFTRQPDDHVLLFTTHHLVCDGWSSWLLLEELRSCYSAARQDEAPDLPPLEDTYADYVAWQQELLAKEGETLWAYWREQLSGELPILNLPTDHPRPATRTYQGGSQRLKLPDDLYAQLTHLAQQQGVTLYALCLAAFQVLLHRYSGQDDILVGSPFAGRNRPEFAAICGDFASPVVLRADLSGDPTFADFLQQVRRTLLGALDHQEYPFPLLVERLQPERSPSIPPIFQAMFTLQQTQGDSDALKLAASALDREQGAINWGGLQLSSLDLPLFEGQFDLTLDILTTADVMVGILRYNSDLFEPATIERMAGHFQTLLQSIIADPQQSIAKLSLLTTDERRQLLVEWNDTARPYPQEQCLHQLVEAQVGRTPDATALLFEGEQLTYAELNQRANQLAHHLQSTGVAPDVLVAICMERSLAMVVALLGVLKAGGAYVPLDPTYPAERLAFLLADAQAPILLTQAHLCEELPATDAQVICLDRDWSVIQPHATENPVSAVRAQDLAYVIYTSGSTGQPKGAMNSHLGICNRLLWMQEHYQLTADDRVLQKTPFSFDVAVWEFFWPLLVGARLVILKAEGHKDPFYLSRIIEEQAITTIHFVPSMLQSFLTVADPAQCHALRRVICSGEALSLTLQTQFFAKLTNIELHNLYGPTEAAIDVTYWHCQRETALTTVPIGRPVANTQIYLLDQQLQPVPIGVPGELYIGGRQVARGYHRRPQLTAERFVDNPYGAGKLYKTGDLGRYLSDGAIEFLGRLDNQVKIRGFRIELGEIEAALRQYPTVREAVVVLQEDRGDAHQLVAYLVAEEPVLPAELRTALQSKLPDYMIPAAFVPLDALPLTPNGKLDRKALPDPEQPHLAGKADYVPPSTPTEVRLATIWSELLSVPHIGIHENFFALGGHSLLATQVLARIRAAFAVELSLQAFFAAATIAEIARAVDDALQADQTSTVEPLARLPRDEPVPLSHAQERLWFLAQLEGGNSAYTIPCLLRITGQLDTHALEASLREIVQRHEILRTTFTTTESVAADSAGDDQPVQVIGEATFALAIVQLAGQSAADVQHELTQLIEAEIQRGFDLAQGPLMRAVLLCPPVDSSAPDTHFLLLHMHHIVADGWSLGILVRELATLYRTFAQGDSSPLAPLPIQYADFAVWQRNWLSAAKMAEELGYWRKQLAGAPPLLELPTDRPRPAQQSFHGATEIVALPNELAASIAKLSAASNTTLSMTLLAAFNVLLMRYSGQEDIVIGTPIANRNRVEVEPLIGFFVNTLALRLDLSGQPTFRELLEQVRTVTLNAYRRQALPFEKLVEELQPQRNLSHAPLFQVMFDFQQDLLADVMLPELRLEMVEFPYPIAKFDLTLAMQAAGDGRGLDGGLRGFWEYNTDLFDAATIERLAHHFQTLLENIVADPDQAIDRIPLLTPAERQQLLVHWNESEATNLVTRPVHQLFAEQASRTPDAVAIAFSADTTVLGNGTQDLQPNSLCSLSYQTLNERANQLAHYLQALGVQPEMLVGICVDRSPEMIVAMLGVLKAGAAYVPIDPMYPAERIRYILDDTQAAIVLTQTHLRPLLQTSTCQLFFLDGAWDEIAHLPRSVPQTDVTPAQLAYVIYTSGSTGAPKGVMIDHRSLTAFCRQTQRDYTLTPHDRLLQFAPFSFDTSVEEIYPALLAGATVVLRTEEMLRSVATFLQCCQEWGVTVITPPVAYWHLLVNEMVTEQLALPPALRLVTIGGERVSHNHVRQWWASVGETPALLNEYGPTETTVAALRYKVTAQWVDGADQPIEVPIGRPLSTVQAYVLDRQLNPVPIGVLGELYLGGVQVARGYWRQPALMAEKFIPNPFGTGTLYRTGDLARYLPDGNIAFVGRADDQVKIRGFRVELGEIESTLTTHSAVAEAVVLLYGETDDDKQLVAYLVWQEDAALADDAPLDAPNGDAPNVDAPTVDTRPQPIAALQAYLRQKLPDYMIPTRLIPLAALPWTANDKIDRNALPRPDELTLDVAAPNSPPRTPTETTLAAIWADILKQERVGIQTNFFEAGGHSLLATQITSRIRRHFAVDLPLRTLFAAPTIAELAAAVEALQQAAQPEEHAPIQPVTREHALPLSHAQERLWFLDQLEGGSTQYNMTSALRLRGTVDVDALAKAFDAIVNRHESLRTIFHQIDGRPVQLITESKVTLQIVDLMSGAQTEEDTAIHEQIEAELHHRFDLRQGPLVRATLVRPHPQSADPQRNTLLFNIHHIIFDGWSMDVFLRELATLYAAFHQGQPSPLTPLPIQYADFAGWQRAWLQEHVMVEQLAYWRTALSGAPPLLELPTDRPRPPLQTFNGAHYLTKLPQPLSVQIQQLATRHDATLFMVLLAAFNVLLLRYSGQADVSVGSPIANRNRVELEALIGFFVNTLVLRNDLAGNPTFLELLQQVKETTLDAYRHQDIPFEKLVEELQPQRNLSHAPLVQVLFVLQNIPDSSIQLPELTLEEMPLASVIAQFDLTLGIQEEDGCLHCLWEYNTDLFDATTVARMAGHFQTLLQGIIAQPGRRINQLPLLTTAEEHQLLVTWNATATAYPEDQCIHHLFEAQAAQNSDALALVAEASGPREEWSYRELNQRANQLAHHLQACGVGPDTRVGIYLDHSPETVIALLGTLKAGGAYVPLDPDYPPASLAFRLADAQIPIVITRQSLAATLPAHDAQIVLIDQCFDELPVTNLTSNIGPEHLAYLIYTSGSTGEPNGVLIEHGALCNSIVSDIRTFDITPSSRLPHVTSFNFDAATSHLFMGLCAGATVYLLPRDPDLLHTTLVHLLETEAITHAVFPVAMLAALPEMTLPALKVLGAGADVCPPELVARWGKGRRFFNVYGPTEATITATIAECKPDEYKPSIGRPIANLQTYILDEHHQPVPIGVPGELHIGGVGLARGYLNRAQLTAERFVHVDLPVAVSQQPSAVSNQQPFPAGVHTQRLYKTGDLARWLPNGTIEFLGRIDNQVKIRGFRVELGEVASALTEHPAVWDAVVVPWDDGSSGKRLVAYVVLDGAQRAVAVDQESNTHTPAALRAFLQERLPDHMIPSAYVVLDALPLTVNGKVDRKALPVPDTTAFGHTAARTAPRTATEASLIELWQTVLQLEQVGIDDNFFEVGGDSILSIQIVARAQQAGLHITPKQIFQHQTIAELAAVATVATGGVAEQGIVTGDVPLTPIQHWYFQQNQPEPHHFNQSVLLETASSVEPARLTAALQALYQHHDALRLRYVQEGTSWQQVNGDVGEGISCRVIDLSAYSEQERVARLADEVEHLQAGLDLTNGPLMQALLADMGSARPKYLLIVIHHLVVDGISWRILLEDLETVYRQLSRGEAVQLPAKTTSFRAWSQWLQAHGVQMVAAEVAHWAEQHRTPISPLPIDFMIEQGKEERMDHLHVAASAEVRVTLSTAETAALLKEVSAVYQTQINDLLLAALLQSICRWTGADHLLLDLEGHGRTVPESGENIGENQPNLDLARTVGWFTLLYPVRLELDRTAPGELIKSVKEQLRRIPNHGIGYGMLRYLTNAPNLSTQTEPQISFNYLGQVDATFTDAPAADNGNLTSTGRLILGNASLPRGAEQSPRHRRTHLLAVDCLITEGQLQMVWNYSPAIHRQETIETLAQEYIATLQALIAHCLNPNAGGYTPSDFAATTLDQDELDDLLATLEI